MANDWMVVQALDFASAIDSGKPYDAPELARLLCVMAEELRVHAPQIDVDAVAEKVFDDWKRYGDLDYYGPAPRIKGVNQVELAAALRKAMEVK